MDSHISLSRLHSLSDEIVIVDKREAEHLKQCHHCRELLRRFAEDRVRRFFAERQGDENKSA